MRRWFYRTTWLIAGLTAVGALLLLPAAEPVRRVGQAILGQWLSPGRLTVGTTAVSLSAVSAFLQWSVWPYLRRRIISRAARLVARSLIAACWLAGVATFAWLVWQIGGR
jgi:hypothetical protein